MISLKKNLDCQEFCLISDIEGAEASILLNDSHSLRNCVEIVMEIEDTCELSVSQQINCLERLGFQLVYRYGDVGYFQKRTRRL